MVFEFTDEFVEQAKRGIQTDVVVLKSRCGKYHCHLARLQWQAKYTLTILEVTDKPATQPRKDEFMMGNSKEADRILEAVGLDPVFTRSAVIHIDMDDLVTVEANLIGRHKAASERPANMA